MSQYTGEDKISQEELQQNCVCVLNSVLIKCFDLCIHLCVDQVVREALRDDRKVMTKSSSVDLVTQTDQRVEQLIIQSVKEKFPTHK